MRSFRAARRVVLALVTTAVVALPVLAALPAMGAASSDLPVARVGRAQIPFGLGGGSKCFDPEIRPRAVVDPVDGRLLTVTAYVTPAPDSCDADLPGLGVWLRAYSTSTLRRDAQVKLELPGFPLGASTSRNLIQLAVDSVHHRLWVLYVGLKAQDVPGGVWLAQFSLDRLDRARSLAPLAPSPIEVPSCVNPATDGPAAVSKDDPTETVTASTQCAAGVPALGPVDLVYDARSNSLDVLQMENCGCGNGGNSSGGGSRRGPFTHEPFVFEFDALSGRLRWVAQLGLCSDPLQAAYGSPRSFDPTLLRTPAGVAGGCVYTGHPPVGPLNEPTTLGNAQIAQPGGHSMMSWMVPLADNFPSGPVVYSVGRPAVTGGVADADTGRVISSGAAPSSETATSASGPTAVVFDVANGAYTGAPTIGVPAEGIQPVAMTVAGGRLYAAGLGGITIADMTATPPGQGQRFPVFSCRAIRMIADPGSRRLFIQPTTSKTCDPASVPEEAPYLLVYQDRLPSVAPSATPDPDGYTTQVAERPGVTASSYTGHGEASAVRVRLIGGTSGFVKGATFNVYDPSILNAVLGPAGKSEPADYSTRELVFGAALGANLSNFDASAKARSVVSDTATGKQLAPEGWPFAEVSCSGQQAPGPSNAYGPATGASVSCDRAGPLVSSQASGEGLDLAVTLRGVEAPQTRPLSVGHGSSLSKVWVDPGKGLISQTSSVARGIEVGPVTIGEVSAAAMCAAHGRAGTAACSYTRTINGVAGLSGAPSACTETWDSTNGYTPGSTQCDDLIAALNDVYPGFLVFSLSKPDRGRGYIGGSPGGYQAAGQREFYEHLQDQTVNYDDSLQIPGLKIVYVNDAYSQPSRLDVQLANVQAEARYGISLISQCAAACAPPRLGGLPIVGPGLLPPPGPPPPMDSGDGGGIIGRGVHLVERAFAGLRFILRSPSQILLVALVLGLLGLPLWLSARRRRLERLDVDLMGKVMG